MPGVRKNRPYGMRVAVNTEAHDISHWLRVRSFSWCTVFVESLRTGCERGVEAVGKQRCGCVLVA